MIIIYLKLSNLFNLYYKYIKTNMSIFYFLYKIMKLNVITAWANNVWNALLKKVASPTDITVWLSRRWFEYIPYTKDIRITDLSNLETTKKELSCLFQSLHGLDIDHIQLFHNCCYSIAEVPNLDSNHPLAKNPKLKKIDTDGDGIDDRTYHALLSTFRNVFSLLKWEFTEVPMSIWIICSLIDKKSYIPTIFDSMVRTNWMVRDELQQIIKGNEHIHAVVVSASTVATDTEVHFRPYSDDKEYRVTGEQVAKSLIDNIAVHKNPYEDHDLFIVHPDWENKFKNETDDQMTVRLMKEIWLIK